MLAVVGAVGGEEYNLFAGLDLPRIPIDEGSLTTGGVIFLIAALAGTLLAAIAGGKAGERYHHRVDELGHAPARRPVGDGEVADRPARTGRFTHGDRDAVAEREPATRDRV